MKKIIIISLFSSICWCTEPIKLGISTHLTDPVGFQGKEEVEGIKLYLKKINASGGINGRKLELIALDDKFDALIIEKNIKQLIEKDEVLAIFGGNGTTQLFIAIPIVEKHHILFFGASTGSPLARLIPPSRYVINFRAGLKETTDQYVNVLLAAGIKPTEMAMITENSAPGMFKYSIFIEALKKSGFEKGEELPYGRFNNAYGRYHTGVYDIENAVANILRTARLKKFNIKAIYLNSSGELAAIKAILLIHRLIPDTIIYTEFDNLEWMTKKTMEEINTNDIKIITVSVVPTLSSNLPALKEYYEDLKKFATEKEANLNSLEGYLSAKLFVKVLQHAAQNNMLTREGIIDVFENLRDCDIGIGVNITISKEDHQALHKGWPAIFKKDQLIPLEYE